MSSYVLGVRLAGAISLISLASVLAVAAPAGAADPAKVSAHVAEADLVKITLTPLAEKRLGIRVATLEKRAIARTRTLGGEVIYPSGDASLTRYAATGSMSATELAGAQIASDGAVDRARVARDAARARFERFRKLFGSRTISERARDDAAEELGTAEAALKMAQAQRQLLGGSLSAAPGKSKVWIRAAVFTGDLPRLNLSAEARVSALNAKRTSRAAQSAASPATANSQTSTAFVFYEADNSDGALRLGERVDLVIPMTETRAQLVVPWTAILYDINGGEWVYERTAPQVFVRRRVQVAAVMQNDAVLASGPAAGAQIVSVGAPELFGTEFGVSH